VQLTWNGAQTRMQIINPSGSSNIGSGVIRATYRMATTEGILSLWRGMSSVIVGAGRWSYAQRSVGSLGRGGR
jgi:hypothetical protein